MLAKQVNIVDEIYRPLQLAAAHFNLALYEDALPAHVFTLQRAKKTLGYFSPNRWRRQSGELEIGEIALNPRTLSNRPLWMLFQTIVREQCHLWQHAYGTPARPGYHNVEWADKMEGVGLVPTATGRLGGPRTGQKLSTYPIAGGAFARACVSLLRSEFSFPWVDCNAAPPIVAERLVVEGADPEVLVRLNAPLSNNIFSQHDVVNNKAKVGYKCPACKTNVWGKPDIILLCGHCNVEYIPHGW